MVHEKVKSLMNFYAPNNIVSKIYKAKIPEIQREVYRATVIIKDVNTLFKNR